VTAAVFLLFLILTYTGKQVDRYLQNVPGHKFSGVGMPEC